MYCSIVFDYNNLFLCSHDSSKKNLPEFVLWCGTRNLSGDRILFESEALACISKDLVLVSNRRVSSPGFGQTTPTHVPHARKSVWIQQPVLSREMCPNTPYLKYQNLSLNITCSVSTKLATFPFESQPRRKNLVPARFVDLRDIKVHRKC